GWIADALLQLVAAGRPLWTTARRAGGAAPAAGDCSVSELYQGWGPHVLWAEREGHEPALRGVRGEDPQRGHTGRLAHRAAHEIRAAHQPQDGPGPGADHPAHLPLPGGRGAPMKTMALLVTLTLGVLVAPLVAEAQQTTKVPRIG